MSYPVSSPVLAQSPPTQAMSFLPFSSSPLSSPTEKHTPSSSTRRTSTNRRSQYKSHASSSSSKAISPLSPSRQVHPGPLFPVAEAPQKALLRDRLKSQCLKRAKLEREATLRRRRHSEAASSEADDVEMEEDEQRDEVDDEVRSASIATLLPSPQ